MLISDSKIPVRLPVKWYFNENTSDIIVIEYEKNFSKIESIISKLFNSPNSIKRPLDTMNSRLWLLMDGSHNFREIVEIMESEFKEDIVPSRQRITTSIMKFIELRLTILITSSEEINWSIESSKKH
ncbi:MAG: hypothetical protein ACJZ46_06045 [Candidatus Thalassarchaeaceae archaeon]